VVQCFDLDTQAHDHSDDNHLYLLYNIHVRALSSIATLCLLPLDRFIAKIPDPFIGPKGVRILLLLRGIGGCAFFIEYSFAWSSHRVFISSAPLGYLGYTTPSNIYLSQMLPS